MSRGGGGATTSTIYKQNNSSQSTTRTIRDHACIVLTVTSEIISARDVM